MIGNTTPPDSGWGISVWPYRFKPKWGKFENGEKWGKVGRHRVKWGKVGKVGKADVALMWQRGKVGKSGTTPCGLKKESSTPSPNVKSV
ncbi:hypothetical protein E3N88_17013 [Mikania micrantha]|uniref:Uncharacterized protein n=1 Tax=Mikania micrantha TaxID=192012 RepID=A0A5N6NTM7_9ASTR|nr:hypothetical protein E3N88_17013 [Mikania micrantha]